MNKFLIALMACAKHENVCFIVAKELGAVLYQHCKVQVTPGYRLDRIRVVDGGEWN